MINALIRLFIWLVKWTLIVTAVAFALVIILTIMQITIGMRAEP